CWGASMPGSEAAEVVVIGAGASGLSAAGALERRGCHAIVLEQDEAIGGTWARRYERLQLHTLRGFSGLATSTSRGTSPGTCQLASTRSTSRATPRRWGSRCVSTNA